MFSSLQYLLAIDTSTLLLYILSAGQRVANIASLSITRRIVLLHVQNTYYAYCCTCCECMRTFTYSIVASRRNTRFRIAFTTEYNAIKYLVKEFAAQNTHGILVHIYVQQ